METNTTECRADADPQGLWACSCNECTRLQHECNQDQGNACDCKRCDPEGWEE